MNQAPMSAVLVSCSEEGCELYTGSPLSALEALSELREVRPGVYHTPEPLSRLRARLRRSGDRRPVLVVEQSKLTSWVSLLLRCKRSGAQLPWTSLQDLLPDHQVRVDVLGNGTFPFLALPPAGIETINDRNGTIHTFFRALRLRPLLLLSLSQILDPDEEDWSLSDLRTLLMRDGSISVEDPTPAAFAFMVRARHLLHARLATTRRRVVRQRRHPEEVYRRPDAAALYHDLDLIDPLLSDVHGRLARMQIERNTPRKMIEFYDGPETLFWIDPKVYAATLDRIIRVPRVQGSVVVFSDSLDTLADACASLDKRRLSKWITVPFGTAGLLIKPPT